MSIRRASVSQQKIKSQLAHTSKQSRQDQDVSVAPSAVDLVQDQKRERTEVAVLRAAFFLFFLLFWSIRYRDFLYVAQQYDLFIWNADYLHDAASRVAGLSRWISSFFIQFFYIPVVGATILSGAALFIQFATEKIFRLRRWNLFLSFIPPCLLSLVITGVNYFIFERIDVAYAFSFVFNFSFALLFALIFQQIRTTRIRFCYLAIALVAFYPVFGFFTLLAGVFCCFIEWNRPHAEPTEAALDQNAKTNESQKLGKTPQQIQRERCEAALLFVLLVPCLYWFVFSQTTPNFYRLYSAGLWEESTLTQGRSQDATNVFSPFLMLLQGKKLTFETDTNAVMSLYLSLTIICYVFIALLQTFGSKRFSSSEKNPKKSVPSKARRLTPIKFTIGIVALLCVCTTSTSFSTPNYQALLKVAQALDQEDWEKIVKIESKISDPINPLITARVLALTRTNRLAEEAFLRPNVPKDSMSLRSITTFCMCGDRILYEFGLTNLAARTAANNFITKRDRSVWALKTLALSAIVDERPALAKRYLYRLRSTLFYRKFANDALAYLAWKESGSSLYNAYLSSSAKTSPEKLAEMDRRFNAIKSLKPQKDDISSSGTVDTVRYRVAQTSTITNDVQTDENLLTTLLLSRNFPRFTEVLDDYLRVKGGAPIPRSIQEAILFRRWKPSLFNPEQTTWTEPQGISLDPQVESRFQDFISTLRPNKSEEELNAQLQKKFGDTFWFFFGSAVDIPNY